MSGGEEKKISRFLSFRGEKSIQNITSSPLSVYIYIKKQVCMYYIHMYSEFTHKISKC